MDSNQGVYDEDAFPSVHIGPRLRELCDSHVPRITQVDLAEALAPLNEGRPLDAAVPSTWMGGTRYRPVPGKYLPAIADFLGTTIDYLISGTKGQIAPRRRQVPLEEEPPIVLAAPVIYSIAAISGHTIGQWYYEDGSRGAPGRPAVGTPAGYWRLRCHTCGWPHSIELGQHGPRLCHACASPLSAAVTVSIQH